MAEIAGTAAEDDDDLLLDDDDLPLPVLWAEAMSIYQTVTSSGPADNEAAIRRCLVVLDKVASLLRLSGVFSSNEEADDVKTTDLPYLLVDHMVAKLLPLALLLVMRLQKKKTNSM